MTREELQARMEAICEEFGLTLEGDEIEIDGKVTGERYGFPKDEVEALDADRRRRFEEMRHDLIVDATGTRVVFSTKTIPVGSHNVDPEETEDVTRLWMDVSIDAEDLHRIFSLATIGAAMLGGAMGKKIDPIAMQSHMSSLFPNMEAATVALYKAEEVTSIIEEENLRFAHHEQIKELAALPDEGMTISDLGWGDDTAD